LPQLVNYNESSNLNLPLGSGPDSLHALHVNLQNLSIHCLLTIHSPLDFQFWHLLVGKLSVHVSTINHQIMNTPHT